MTKREALIRLVAGIEAGNIPTKYANCLNTNAVVNHALSLYELIIEQTPTDPNEVTYHD